MSFLLVHDIAEHGGAMADLGQALFKQCDHEGFSCAVFAVDLPGHGHCGDECGQFTMQQMVETVQEASSWIRNRTREGAVITVGQGLGGEVALHAGAGHEPITATIANGLWLPSELSLRPQVLPKPY
jgi:alpha-beta hydrolase superfamily lysophospholipase